MLTLLTLLPKLLEAAADSAVMLAERLHAHHQAANIFRVGEAVLSSEGTLPSASQAAITTFLLTACPDLKAAGAALRDACKPAARPLLMGETMFDCCGFCLVRVVCAANCDCR